MHNKVYIIPETGVFQLASKEHLLQNLAGSPTMANPAPVRLHEEE